MAGIVVRIEPPGPEPVDIRSDQGQPVARHQSGDRQKGRGDCTVPDNCQVLSGAHGLFCSGALGQDPIGADEMARVAMRDTFQIILMLWLGFPEIAYGFQLGLHLARPQTRSLDIQDRILCQPFLVVRRVVDARAIGGATVVALPVQRGRVVDLEKNSNSWRYDIFAGSKITSIPSAWVP